MVLKTDQLNRIC